MLCNDHELAMVLCRGIGPWGPALVRKYAGVRFGTYASGNMLNEQESKLFSGWLFLSFLFLLSSCKLLALLMAVKRFYNHNSTVSTVVAVLLQEISVTDVHELTPDYLFHTLAGRASGELCLKYIFSLGAFARTPLITRFVSEHVPGMHHVFLQI